MTILKNAAENFLKVRVLLHLLLGVTLCILGYIIISPQYLEISARSNVCKVKHAIIWTSIKHLGPVYKGLSRLEEKTPVGTVGGESSVVVPNTKQFLFMVVVLSKRQNVFLVNKSNRRTEFQFYWYYRVLADAAAPRNTRSPDCINCTNAVVRLRTPDDGQKDCPNM
jgi:hypothetical protein